MKSLKSEKEKFGERSMKIIKKNVFLHAKLRKFLVLGTALCLISGCSVGEKSSAETSAPEQIEEIKMDGENTVGDLSFTVESVTTTKEIKEMYPVGSGISADHFNLSDENNIFLDVVLKITNVTDSLYDTDFSNSYYKYGDDDPVDVTMAYEYSSRNLIEKLMDLNEKTSKDGYLHCFSETSKEKIDKGETLVLQVKDSKAKLDIKDTLLQKKYTNIGDTITNDNVNQITFVSLDRIKSISPSAPGSIFTSSLKADAGKTYLLLRIDYKNLSGKTVSAFGTVIPFTAFEAEFAGKYDYSDMSTFLEDDGSWTLMGTIDPLETGKLYCCIQIPDEIINEPVEVTVKINNDSTYYLKG